MTPLIPQKRHFQQTPDRFDVSVLQHYKIQLRVELILQYLRMT